MSRIGVAGLQLEAVNGDNLDSMEAEIDAVVKRFPWVDMVVLGELNACGTNKSAAESLPGPTEQRFCEAAHRNGIWLLPGSFHEKADGVIYNTCPVIDPDGKVVARHRKQFPWRPYETEVAPGDRFTVFDVPGESLTVILLQTVCQGCHLR